MKRLMALFLMSLFSVAVLSGCNTVAGAGKDMQKAGEKVEDKAQDCSDGKC
ncbi:entericidin A/B family lipoprotein [Pseudoxanthomonas mexicana]|uniref:entericidin A/B family lipoprotein n=1 Tax=Pseudoxanthomonas mexicana TaxID=128785 RepID=UPI00398AA366